MLSCHYCQTASPLEEQVPENPLTVVKTPLVLINITQIPFNSQLQWLCIHKHPWHCILYKKLKLLFFFSF